jgi:hypothetical protein
MLFGVNIFTRGNDNWDIKQILLGIHKII